MKGKLILAAGAAAIITGVGAGGASALIGINTAAPVGPDGSNGADNGIHDTKKSETYNCETDGSRTITYAGPKEIWPPNHKMRNVAITAKGADSDNISLTVVGTHDQYTESGEELNGSGNTETDFFDTTPGAGMGTGSVTEDVQIRGERSGRDKTGRTYTLDVLATFNGEECSTQFTALVPHDQRNQTNTGSQKPSKTKKARKARRARR